uniref:WAPL domain-containing protein n=1 Tax=Gongylonema pulchrum TaxID=637853 RepID=A0A183DKT6_9BILA
LGGLDDFLPQCVSSVTYLVPKYVNKSKQYDLTILFCSLLVNLLERSVLNRSKIIGLKVSVYDAKTKKEECECTLKVFTQVIITARF